MNYASKNAKKRKRSEDGEGSDVEAVDKADDQVGLLLISATGRCSIVSQAVLDVLIGEKKPEALRDGKSIRMKALKG